MRGSWANSEARVSEDPLFRPSGSARGRRAVSPIPPTVNGTWSHWPIVAVTPNGRRFCRVEGGGRGVFSSSHGRSVLPIHAALAYQALPAHHGVPTNCGRSRIEGPSLPTFGVDQGSKDLPPHPPDHQRGVVALARSSGDALRATLLQGRRRRPWLLLVFSRSTCCSHTRSSSIQHPLQKWKGSRENRRPNVARPPYIYPPPAEIRGRRGEPPIGKIGRATHLEGVLLVKF